MTDGVVLNFKVTREGVRPVRILLFGPTGSGKTFMGAQMWRELRLGPKERSMAVGPVPTLAELTGLPWHNISTTDKAAQDKFFGKIEKSDEHMFLLLDEFDGYCTAHGYKSQALYELVDYGRNFGKGMICIARGTSDTSKNLVANSQAICWFRTTEPNLLDYIRRYLRDFPGGAAEAEECITNLGEHQCLLYLPMDNANKYPGILKVVDGSIRLFPLPSTSESESTDGTADTSTGGPVVVRPSPTGGGADSARSTTPSGPKNRGD